MAGRKSKKRNKQDSNKLHRDVDKRLKQQVEKNLPDKDLIVVRSRDGIKMSQVLERFVEPYMEQVKTEDAYRKLLSIAVAVWNVALLPSEKRLAYLNGLQAMLPDEVRDEGKKTVVELLERKEKHFSHYRRMIIDFDVADTGSGWYISVISTPEPV